jgi:hypothetical protein
MRQFRLWVTQRWAASCGSPPWFIEVSEISICEGGYHGI